MNETRTLARFVAAAAYEQLPEAVIQHAKNLVLDHFAVALFASKTECGRIAVKYARQFSATAEATVYGEPWQTSAQHAALANGLCAHGFELDDSYQGGYCHPGAPTIPAALAFYKDLADPRSFDEQVLSNREVLATARQVEGYLDAEVNAFPRYGARVTAEMQDGQEVTVTAWDHKGTPAKPFSRADITRRFHKITAGIIDTAAAERIIHAVDGLDTDSNDSLQSLSLALRLSA